MTSITNVIKTIYQFFVCSDIHSAYTPWMEALTSAGFDESNPRHKIILCGDLFDRMGESSKVYKFAKDMLEKGKLIYVKGNHEQLLVDCCHRGYPLSHDIHNGTARTIEDLGYGIGFEDWCEYTLAKIRPLRNKMVNYFETKNYIFVHSWIPVNEVGCDKYEYKEDWREATDSEWEAAMWGNPFFKAQDGLNKTSKTIVFGHWHCSTGHAIDSGFEIGEFEPRAIWDPYINETTKIIGIDRCTAHTGKVNVIVIEDEFLESDNNEDN